MNLLLSFLPPGSILNTDVTIYSKIFPRPSFLIKFLPSIVNIKFNIININIKIPLYFKDDISHLEKIPLCR